jgi:hypothetical protein
MNKAELLKLLDDIDDEDEVVIISQPFSKHPTTYGIDKTSSSQYADKVYLVEGPQIGYTDREVVEGLQLRY